MLNEQTNRTNHNYRDSLVGLVAYFCYQVAYGAKETCPGLMDGSKCLIMDNTLYQNGFYDGKNAGLIAFYHIDDSTIPAHTDQYNNRHSTHSL